MIGVEGLSRRHSDPRPRGRARLAALFALLPGMGAVYNHQNIKGVVHFAAIVGLFQLTAIHIASGFFALAGLAFYLYSIVDAYRTAQLIAAGESAVVDEERFKRSLVKRAPLVGIVLITSGLLLVLQIVRPFAWVNFARLFPVLLIILGGFLLTRYFKRSREVSYEQHAAAAPYSLVPGRFNERSSEQSGPRSHPAGRR